jgi:hypothetical protein
MSLFPQNTSEEIYSPGSPLRAIASLVLIASQISLPTISIGISFVHLGDLLKQNYLFV